MIVTFISQCEKKALQRTRLVLDAFADRIGHNTWQTVITEDGLVMVKNCLHVPQAKIPPSAVTAFTHANTASCCGLWVIAINLMNMAGCQ